MSWNGIVKENIYDEDLKQDSISVFIPMLQSEYKDTQRDVNTQGMSPTITNMCSEEGAEFTASSKIEETVNFIAYPKYGSGGQGGSGSVIVPDIGDTVTVERIDNSDTFYYTNGAKKTEFTNESINNMDSIESSNTEDGDIVRNKASNPNASQRQEVKVVHQTKSDQSLSFTETVGKVATLLKNQAMQLKMLSGSFIELVTNNGAAGSKGFRASMDKVEIFNGSGDSVFSSTATDLKIKIANDMSIEGTTLTIDTTGVISIEGSAVNITNCDVTVTSGDVIADGISLKTHTHTGDSGGSTSGPL